MREYRAVYVVSDLHLGGYTGVPNHDRSDWVALGADAAARAEGGRDFRIFRDAPALAWAIDRVTDDGLASRPEGRVALALNGDIVDFLASPDARGFDPDGARAKLERIVADPAQQPVWAALRRYLALAAGDLVLVLGNHDVELAMHDAGDYLDAYLTEGDPARRERLVRCYDGEGFACAVGGRRVLVVHGNGVDPWNEVDYAGLARYAAAKRQSSARPAFRANAGSALVAEHMNAVKRAFQWIDLLKPEQEGAALVAAALDPGRKAPIGLLLENVARGPAMRKAILLGEQPAAPPPLLPGDRGRGRDDDFLGGAPPPALGGDGALFGGSAGGPRGRRAAVPAAGREREAETLGAVALLPGLAKLAMGASLRAVLREHLPRDRSFDPLAADEAFEALDEATDERVDFLVAGHTHLERSLKRRRGQGYYFNSGTWIKLVEIPASALASDAFFEPVKAALQDGSMEALERPVVLPDGAALTLSKSVRTVVRLRALEGGGARGMLLHVEGGEGSFAFRELLQTGRTLQPAGH